MSGKPTPVPIDRFDGMIGPGQILAWVQSSCPYLELASAAGSTERLATLAAGPDGWLRILRVAPGLIGAKPSPETRLDYLALCLAAHHATVGSYVPTDVDSKIRGDLWRKASGTQLRERWELAKSAHGWSPLAVSTRVETTAQGLVSGHDGEWLGVAVGALGAALLANDADITAEASTWIDGELDREVAAFTAAETTARARGATDATALTLVRLAWILTHNVGDVDQGLSYWVADTRQAAARSHLAELAHSGPERHGGAFVRAKALYQLVAAEGHRHYPLRAVKSLRSSADLLLPLGPCFEAWGARVALSPVLTDHDRAEILATLLDGISKVKGQLGYHRALVGLSAVKGGLPMLVKRLKPAAVRMLDDLTVRKQLTISEAAFAASLAKRVRTALG